MKKTAVIFESFEGSIRVASWEALTCAIGLSSANGDEIQVILPADNPTPPASAISEKSGYKVLAIDTGTKSYNSDIAKKQLAKLLGEQHFTHICLAGTTQGLDYAPGLAVRMGITCTTGVESISRADSGISVSRSLFGGKIVESVPVDEAGGIIVTQPGTFTPFTRAESSATDIELHSDDNHSDTVFNLEVRQVQEGSSALAEASVIIAAGRGIKEMENLELVEQLAGVFPRSAVGGSRPLCDLEWLEYKQQVGITGATVAPELYLACGISGAAQHISGMRNSGFIVAVNIDPKAAIFNYADVCIVEDLTTFIPTFVETVKKLKQN